MSGGRGTRSGIRHAMIATFLRPPHGAAEVLADAVRVLGLVSVVAAIIGWTLVDAAVLGLVLIGLVLPRFLGIRPVLDAAFGVSLLVAGWSSVLDIYQAVWWWDIAVHLVTNGLVAAVIYILLVRIGFLPDPATARVPLAATVTLTLALGMAAGVLWEIGEWAGHTFADPTIFVGYTDTIGDLAIGATGALLAGLAGRRLAAESRFVTLPVTVHPATMRPRAAA